MNGNRIITLLTDFGDQDTYVGIMKGVIASIAPEARVVDICHNLPEFHIESAAYMLWTYHNWYPAGTIHCVVVDPGVGSERAAVVIELDDSIFILPDNGIATMILEGRRGRYRAYTIENRDFMISPVSATFHGRDIFAPAAARIAAGASPQDAGPPLESPVLLDISPPRSSGNSVTGTVAHIDRFGNYISNIPASMAEHFNRKTTFVRIGNFTIMGISGTFSDRAPGELVAYFGSTGLLEIGVTKGSALDTIKSPVGARVKLTGRTTEIDQE